MVPWAVITTTHASPRISRRRPSAVSPSTPGIRTSRNTTSKGSASKASRALVPAEVHLAEERVQAHPRRQGESPAASHRVQRVAHEVVEDLEQPVLVAEDRRKARIVPPDHRDAALARALLVQERDALEQLMQVQRHRAQLDRARQVE